jgi:hypothetical protein
MNAVGYSTTTEMFKHFPSTRVERQPVPPDILNNENMNTLRTVIKRRSFNVFKAKPVISADEEELNFKSINKASFMKHYKLSILQFQN